MSMLTINPDRAFPLDFSSVHFQASLYSDEVHAIADRIFDELNGRSATPRSTGQVRPDIPKERLENLIALVERKWIKPEVLNDIEQFVLHSEGDPIQVAVNDLKDLVAYAGKVRVRQEMETWATPASSPRSRTPSPALFLRSSPELVSTPPLAAHTFTLIKAPSNSLLSRLSATIYCLFLRHILDVAEDLLFHKIFS